MPSMTVAEFADECHTRRDHDGDDEDARIEPGLIEARNVRGSEPDERTDAEHGQQQARGGCESAVSAALAEQLSDETSPAGTQSACLVCQTAALTCGAACQQEIGNVAASDQEHAEHRAVQQRGADIVSALTSARSGSTRIVGARLRSGAVCSSQALRTRHSWTSLRVMRSFTCATAKPLA